ALVSIEATLVDAPSLEVNTATGKKFELQTTSVSSTPVTFILRRNSNGTVNRECTPDVGGCRGGSW
ncbi:hypothetical protein LCGC14_2489260, partial [marine sediment metagenome]